MQAQRKTRRNVLRFIHFIFQRLQKFFFTVHQLLVTEQVDFVLVRLGIVELDLGVIGDCGFAFLFEFFLRAPHVQNVGNFTHSLGPRDRRVCLWIR